MIIIYPTKDVAPAQYELILESFDANSVQRQTLQTDLVIIKVEGASDDCQV